MSGEIVVSETPNWLQELEAKRERRLKVKLGHEAGAGAPCLKCGEKCPGLDLHFWRKCCKICKCSKEEHEVQDDDIYGWAQFQLLGSKPNIRRKILLPGKKDEIDLDWAPKGHHDTVDKYLKTLPPEQLPLKGTQAAQDRKQLLQKQIPIHDIDPSLCHDLTEDELKKMNEYIAHVKQASAGVGQIVSLSSIIKGNLHVLNPSEAAMIANRYAKNIPMSEIVKLQSQSWTGSLKHQELSENVEGMNLNDKSQPNFVHNTFNHTENTLEPSLSNIIYDKNVPIYNNDSTGLLPGAQFAGNLGPQKYRSNTSNIPNDTPFDPTIDIKYLQNPNFNPKNRPSQFMPQNVPYIPLQSGQNQLSDKNPVNYNPENSAFVPYQKLATVCKPGDSYVQDRTSMDPIYANNIQGHLGNVPSGFENGHQYNEKANRLVPIYAESFSPGLKSQKTGNSLYGRDPQNSFTAHKGKESSGNEISPNGTVVSHKPFQNSGNNVYADQFRNTKTKLPSSFQGNQSLPHSQQIGGETYMNTPTIQDIRANNYENVNDLRNSAQKLPNYAPGKYSTYSDTQSPIRNPKSFRDLAFSTYDPNIINTKELEGGENGFKFGHYRQPGSYSETGQSISKEAPKNSNGFRPIQGGLRNDEQNSNKLYSPKLGYQKSDADLVPKNIENELLDRNIEPFQQNQYHNEDSFKYGDPNSDKQYVPENRLGYPKGELEPYNIGTQDLHVNTPDENTLENDKYSYTADPHMSDEEYSKMPYSGIPNKSMGNYGPGPNESNNFNNPNKPGKTLTEMYPAKLSLDEDFLHPNQVNVGLIHDITYPEIKAATHGTNDFYEDYSPDCIKEILNNIKLPDCHYCKKPFEENEFAVTIERANVLFHAGCFKCAGCNQILADNVYFFNKETDNIYCLRDYAKIRGFPRCKACDELIFTKEYCLAENSTFHLKHFCCIECDKPLAGQDYTLEEEMPYCLPCFEQSKANKCSSCCNIIKPDEVGCNLNGVHFHAVNECFACIVCKKPLMGKKLLLRNEKLYCSHECYGTEK